MGRFSRTSWKDWMQVTKRRVVASTIVARFPAGAQRREVWAGYEDLELVSHEHDGIIQE